MTQFVRFFNIAIVCLISGIGHANDNSARDSFRAGQWDGAAYFSSTGEFSHCAALSSQPKSAILYFMEIEPGILYVGISRASWKLPEGNEYSVAITVDRRYWGTYRAIAVTDQLVRFQIENAERVSALKSATTMEVVAVRETLTLSLKDSRAAIDGLGRCIVKNGGHASNPSATVASTNSKQAGGDADTENFARFVERILQKAGFEDARRVTGEEVGYKKAIFGWKSVKGEGALYSGDGLDQSFIVGLRSDMASKCTGNFVATSPRKQQSGAWGVSSFEFACGHGDSMTGSGILQVFDGNGKTNFVLVNDATGESNVTALIDENLRLGDLMVVALRPD